MLSVLTDRQKAIVEIITMRLHVKQASVYLKEVGFEMSEPTFYREKKKIDNMKLERMHHIAKVVYRDQHLERLDVFGA